MVCKTLGLLLFGKMVLNELKGTRDDAKSFARHPLWVSYCSGIIVLND